MVQAREVLETGSPKSRCQPGHVPSEASKGRILSNLYHLCVDPGVTCLGAAAPHLHTVIPSPSISSLLPLRTLVILD